MKVSDYIFKFLKDRGVTHAFTVPGGFSMHLNDSLHYSGIEPIYMLHESGAAFAACGHSRYTGELGVCLVTSGPGVTNALTGLATAWDDSLPMMFISGDAEIKLLKQRKELQLRQAGPQDVDTFNIVKPLVKDVVMLTDTNSISELDRILKFIYLMAIADRQGPVWLIVPLDVQKRDIQ
jgi:acetolactate synthase I/II/III large subunit